MGEEEWATRLNRGGATRVTSVLRQAGIPVRLAEALVDAVQIPPGQTLAQLRKEERTALLAAVTAFPIACSGHEGYGKVRCPPPPKHSHIPLFLPFVRALA